MPGRIRSIAASSSSIQAIGASGETTTASMGEALSVLAAAVIVSATSSSNASDPSSRWTSSTSVAGPSTSSDRSRRTLLVTAALTPLRRRRSRPCGEQETGQHASETIATVPPVLAIAISARFVLFRHFRGLCLLKSPSADPCATRVGSTCAPAGGLAAGRCDLLPPVRSATQTGMFALLRAFAAAVRTLFCSRADLVLENLALRQQLAILARLARHARHRAARDRHSLAPPRLPPLLALAVTSDRTSLDQSRSANTHPSHRHREPRLGRAANPWRVAQARHRRRPVHGCQVHAAAEQASLADLAHLSAQPYELRCRHRLLYDPDGHLSRPLRLRRPRPRTAPHPPPRRHRAPDCRVDPHPAARRSAGTAALRPSRPWLRLRGTRRLPPSPRLRGGGRQRASVALAESLRRKGDRLHPARFARPCDRPRRGRISRSRRTRRTAAQSAALNTVRASSPDPSSAASITGTNERPDTRERPRRAPAVGTDLPAGRAYAPATASRPATALRRGPSRLCPSTRPVPRTFNLPVRMDFSVGTAVQSAPDSSLCAAIRNGKYDPFACRRKKRHLRSAEDGQAVARAAARHTFLPATGRARPAGRSPRRRADRTRAPTRGRRPRRTR